MLCLSGNVGERVYVGDDIVIMFMEGNRFGRKRIGIEAPREIAIVRETAKRKEPRQAYEIPAKFDEKNLEATYAEVLGNDRIRGNGLNSYPGADANNDLIHDQCLELFRRGRIRLVGFDARSHFWQANELEKCVANGD